ncbi:hypothetical protein M9Y10_033613 [Tritrichomonas musculus]|uniref:DUF4709 domain-containing protein n=1 Tax=Tritrichomonas musculus TaxID=1915356 RepID=A0ABR2KDF3_9EUKA
MSSQAKSVASSRSGRRRVNHVFHADPPLDQQSEQINKYFQDVNKLLSKEKEKESSQAPVNEASFTNLATKISDSIHKLFCDTWRSIRAAQKAEEKNEEANLRSILQEQFQSFQTNITNLRDEQISFMRYLVIEGDSNLSNSLFLNLSKFLNDLVSLFCEDLFEILKKCYEFKDKTYANNITNDLLNKIEVLSDDLNKYHLNLAQLYDQVPQPTNNSSDLNEVFNQALDKQLDGFNAAAELFHDGQKQIFDFSYKLFKSVNFSSKKDVQFNVEKIFNPSINGISDLGQCLIEPTSQEDDQNSTNDADYSNKWENLRKDDYIVFVKKQMAQESDTLISTINQFWGYSYDQLEINRKSHISEQFDIISQLLLNSVKQRFDAHDPTLKASDISLFLSNAVKYNSDIRDELQELLVTQIEQVSANLEILRRKQYKMLSNPPNDENLDYYIEDTKDLTTEIESYASDLNLAFFYGREASFNLIQLPEVTNEDEENLNAESDREENNVKTSKSDQEDIFKFYDIEEDDAIEVHLQSIIDLNNTVYSSIEIPYSPGKAPKPSRRKSSGLSSASDSISVYSNSGMSTSSKKSKSTVSSKMTKASMSQVSVHMDNFIRTQVIAIEDAMCSTYLQLFASIKGILIAYIRLEEYKAVKKINEKFQLKCIEYQNHLLEIKNRASRALDIQTMKDAEQRIQELQNLGINDIEQIINEGLRSKIRKLIVNYEENIADITDDYESQMNTAKTKLQTNASSMMTNIHLPQLILLEKQRKIAYEKEKRRELSQFTQLEDQIREFAKKNDFSRANMEKQKLEALKEEALNKRIEEVDKTYDSKKKLLLQEQQKDLEFLEQNYNQKIVKINQRRTAELDNQMDRLNSAIRSRIQKEARFANFILPEQSKKDISGNLEKIAYVIIRNNINETNRLDDFLNKKFSK